MISYPAQSSHSAAPGRPREFDADTALGIALDLFWRQGYETTSLDDLTSAMGISRSSFYCCFGSKHAVLIQAIRRYVDIRYTALAAMADFEPDPRRAVQAMISAIADASGGVNGCFLVNCITELAPSDPEVIAVGSYQVDRLEKLIGATLAKCAPQTAAGQSEAAGTARALLSIAFGATLMRKTGMPAEKVKAMLDAAHGLIPEEK